jgi:Glyoxalase-like domain
MVTRRSILAGIAGTLGTSWLARAEVIGSKFMNTDHLILGCSNLDEGVDYLERLCGYRAALGGSHPGRGTRNALLKLDRQTYLEILAPDPMQDHLTWHHELATLSQPTLVGWAQRAGKLDVLAANYRKRGIEVSGPVPGSRTLPSGETLRWTVVMRVNDRHGILPFFIEWDSASKHPSEEAPGGCLLMSLQKTGQMLEGLPPKPGLSIKQFPEKPVQLRATIAGLLGEFVLATKSVPSEAWVSANSLPR